GPRGHGALPRPVQGRGGERGQGAGRAVREGRAPPLRRRRVREGGGGGRRRREAAGHLRPRGVHAQMTGPANKEPAPALSASTAFRFVLTLGIVNLFADVTY